MDVIPLTRTEDHVNQGRRLEIQALEPEQRADTIVNRSESTAGVDFHQGESEILRRIFGCFYQSRLKIQFQVILWKHFFHGLGLLYLAILGILSYIIDSR